MDWMTRYLDPADDRPEFRHTFRAGGWVFVTDTRSLLAVRGDHPAARDGAEFFRETPERLGRVLDYLALGPPADAPVADLHDLWLWLDRVEREACGAWCGGSGPPGRGPCPECGGKGWHWPHHLCDDDAATVCGYPFDRNRLAWWLAPELPAGRCRLFLLPEPGSLNRPIVVAGEGWRLLAVSIGKQYAPGRYRAYHPGAGHWWQHRRDRYARLAAADWAVEQGIEASDVFGEPVPLPGD